MPKAYRRANKAAATEVMSDLEPTLTRLAAYHARRRRRTLDEAMSDVTELAFEAYLTHDPARGELEARVKYYVRNRLAEENRRYARRKHHLRQVRLAHGLTGVAAEPTPLPFDRNGLAAKLGADARFVVSVLLDRTPEFDAEVRAAEEPKPRVIRRLMKAYLRELGWSGDRITLAFWEIRRVLS